MKEKLDDFYDEDEEPFDDDFDDAYDFEPEDEEELQDTMADEPKSLTNEEGIEDKEIEEPNLLQEEVVEASESEETVEDTEEPLQESEEPSIEEVSVEDTPSIDVEEKESLIEEPIVEEHIEYSNVIVETEVITQSLEVKETSNVFDIENLENESYDPEFEPKDEIIDGESDVVTEDVSIEMHCTIEKNEEEPLLPALLMEKSVFDNVLENQCSNEDSQEALNEETQADENAIPEINPYYQSKKLKSKKKIYLSVVALILFLGFAISIFFIIKAFM